jgi:hypothetical protein
MRASQAFLTPIPLAITNPKPVTTTLGMSNPLENGNPPSFLFKKRGGRVDLFFAFVLLSAKC